MRILYVGNQGGLSVLQFNLGMAEGLRARDSGYTAAYITYLDAERSWLQARGVNSDDVLTFESWVAARRDVAPDPDRLERKYPQACWSSVVASERTFSDYSLLLTAVGQRSEKQSYTIPLVDNVVTLLEKAIEQFKPTAIVCQLADTLSSHCAFKVAAGLNIPIYGIVPGWLFEKGRDKGGFFSKNELLHSDRMISNYARIGNRKLTGDEQKRIDDLIAGVKGYTGNTAFFDQTSGNPFEASVVSPQWRRYFQYVFANSRLDKDVVYTKFNPWRKTRANLLRMWRRATSAHLMQTVELEKLPSKCVLYAMHFQPEMSTLAQGIFAANQIALIENISKSLPLGYTLIVKEHPVMRGFRPAWQYRHIADMHNVEMCDAPAKEIIRRCDAVLTISGTIAVEALAFGKPAIVFGGNFYNYCDLITTVHNPETLHAVFHDLLIARNVPDPDEFKARLSRFMLSYLEALIPHFPLPANGNHYGMALHDELQSTEQPAHFVALQDA
jgi:hypothetical protein